MRDVWWLELSHRIQLFHLTRLAVSYAYLTKVYMSTNIDLVSDNFTQEGEIIGVLFRLQFNQYVYSVIGLHYFVIIIPEIPVGLCHVRHLQSAKP